jgi:hypothetical protein
MKSSFLAVVLILPAVALTLAPRSTAAGAGGSPLLIESHQLVSF